MLGIAGAGAGAQNATGDVQKKLDVFSNEVFINCLRFSEEVYIMGSEEEDEPIIVGDKTGGYAVVFDPLDGSSNIDCNVAVGTIFGIYKKVAAAPCTPTPCTGSHHAAQAVREGPSAPGQ